MNIWNNRNWTPMLLKEQRNPFDDDNYIFELKFDGIRAIIFVNEKELIIHSRYGKDITFLYPELQEIKKYIKANTILDGEIICLDEGLPSFQKIQTRAHLKDPVKIKMQCNENPVIFMCFDILYQEEMLINSPLIKRKEVLKLIPDSECFVKVKYIENQGNALFKEIKRNHLEGIVAKKKDSIYEINKRVNDWIKIKNWSNGTFYVGGYIENKNHSLSILLAEKRKHDFYYVGKAVLYENNNLYNKIKKQNISKISTLENCSEKANYISPEYTCRVEYIEKTKQGILRHPTIYK